MITFAVIGHNEAPTLEYSLNQASEAAIAGDVVWFVDSVSTDQSSAIAKHLKIKRVRAPIGKGRAMSYAIEQCKTEYICFIDADLLPSTKNLVQAMAETIRTTKFRHGDW
jgi:glucosyl-3-phosphoglycerate synthase